MRKKDFEKRKKFTTNTYMREAIDYDIVIVKEDNLFITIKKYKNVTDTFTLPNKNGEDVVYIDKGYYLVEITPILENYNIRFYYDKNKKFIDFYIDISLENGVQYKLPYYVDLYLDIVHYPESNTNGFCDEDELMDALNNKIISKKDYDLAYRVGNKLLDEINNNTNKYFKIDILKYINKYFL